MNVTVKLKYTGVVLGVKGNVITLPAIFCDSSKSENQKREPEDNTLEKQFLDSLNNSIDDETRQLKSVDFRPNQTADYISVDISKLKEIDDGRGFKDDDDTEVKLSEFYTSVVLDLIGIFGSYKQDENGRYTWTDYMMPRPDAKPAYINVNINNLSDRTGTIAGIWYGDNDASYGEVPDS